VNESRLSLQTSTTRGQTRVGFARFVGRFDRHSRNLSRYQAVCATPAESPRIAKRCNVHGNFQYVPRVLHEYAPARRKKRPESEWQIVRVSLLRRSVRARPRMCTHARTHARAHVREGVCGNRGWRRMRSSFSRVDSGHVRSESTSRVIRDAFGIRSRSGKAST